MGQQDLWYIGGTLRRGKMQGDDIIFPNLDMCLITLAGWFNENLLKKNWNPRCNFIIFEPPWGVDVVRNLGCPEENLVESFDLLK